ERLQPSAFRRRPDRGRGHAEGRHAHASAAAGRQGPRTAKAAGSIAEDPRARGRSLAAQAVPARRAGVFRRLEGRRRAADKGDPSFRSPKHGRGAGRHREAKHRPPPRVGQRQAARCERADPERLQPSAFRGRTDRGDDQSDAGLSHAAAAAGRRGSRAAQSARDVEADQGAGEAIANWRGVVRNRMLPTRRLLSRRAEAIALSSLLVALTLAGAAAATSRSLHVTGTAGYLSEWELTADVTAAQSGEHEQFSGPLILKHVGLCSANGPEEKSGRIELSISKSMWSSQVHATLLVDGKR